MKNKGLPEKVIKSSKKKTKPALNFLLLGAGSMFTSMIVAGFIVGYAIDWFLGTTPLFMLGCGLLGFIGGTMKVQKLLEKMDLMDAGANNGTNKEKKNN